MTDHTTPAQTRKIEITARITRATGEVEHVKLVDGKWVATEPPKDDKDHELKHQSH